MLGKLFKHEFLDLFKKTILFFSIVIGLSLLVFLFGKLAEKYIFFAILNSLFIVGYILSIIGIIAYSIFYPIFRFYKSMLKDEGYLTHTLPVTKAQLLFSKLVTAFILFLASVVIALGSLILTGVMDLEVINLLIANLHENTFVSYLMIIFYMILYYYSTVMMFITALSLGHSRPSKKGLNSFFAGLIIYGVQQALGSIVVLIMFLGLDFQNVENINMTSIFIAPMIISFAMVVTEIFVTNHFLTKKLNLE